jgi:hypothetical protein
MKPSFSQRIGLESATKPLQINDIDVRLRTGIWNIFYLVLIDVYYANLDNDSVKRNQQLVTQIWVKHWVREIDKTPNSLFDLSLYIKDFVLKQKWNHVYELVEFLSEAIELVDSKETADMVENLFNSTFEKEFSAYRFVAGKLSPITNEVEIREIDDALNSTSVLSSIKSCNIHLGKSLKHFADREQPDYSNSIKESISAVESLVKIMTGEEKSTLGDAIKRLPTDMEIHPALIDGIKKIYGYTSDQSGIRHGFLQSEKSDFEDAKFMLVMCSALINYLIGKGQKGGLIFH